MNNGAVRVRHVTTHGAAKSSVYRVVRGGSYFDNAVHCRPANPTGYTPGTRNLNIGFRLVLPLQSVG